MRITDIRHGDRVRYTGSAPGLVGKVGQVKWISAVDVGVRFDGALKDAVVRPANVVRLTGKPVQPSRPLNDGARLPSTLPNDSAERKEYPMAEVLFGQFPAAITAVVHHSWKGNNKHNPGLPMQDNRSKSTDDADCILRHLAEGDYEGMAWRALRLLQRKLEAEGAPIAPLATNLPKE